MLMLNLDHITIAANSLAEGVAYAERALGLTIPAGGAHPLMGTHNHLLQLSETTFLEVIAPDPTAPVARPRWFALDEPSTRADLAASPRFVTWVVNTADIASALRKVPHAAGPAIEAKRGDLAWLISVPPDGSMPFGGAFPTLIQWPPGAHPASRMPDLGCSLVSFAIRHPQAEDIAKALAPLFSDARVSFTIAARPSFEAVIRTPGGERRLT